MGDVSLTHPYIGDADDRSTWGTFKTDHMQRRIDDKNSKYQRFHYQLNYLFLPLVCNTFGLINGEALRLLFLLAHKAATLYFDAIGERIYDDDGKFRAAFLHHRSSLFNRFKSRIALAACRGMARRGDLTSVHHDIGMEYRHFDDDDGPSRRLRRPPGRRRRRRPGRRGGEQHVNEPLWIDERRYRGSSRAPAQGRARG